MQNTEEPALFAEHERFSLDPNSPVPLYHQMEQVILERIQRERAIGRKLPREIDLMKIFGVSRATVKKTTDQLADKGLIERKRAIGTRIVRVNITEDLGRLKSYTEEMESKGLKVSTVLLSSKVHKPEKIVAEKLRLEPGETTLQIRRLRGTSEVFPVVLLQSELPSRLGLNPDEAFEGSLYRILEEYHRIPIEWAEQTISARTATREEASQLRIRPGATVLVMERLTYSTGDVPIEFVRAVYRPEHYSFSIKLKR